MSTVDLEKSHTADNSGAYYFAEKGKAKEKLQRADSAQFSLDTVLDAAGQSYLRDSSSSLNNSAKALPLQNLLDNGEGLDGNVAMSSRLESPHSDLTGSANKVVAETKKKRLSIRLSWKK